ncbi:nucleotide exchange factor GrpE [Limibaculum sp. M0105]|uniref:Protein GrpE n=1 Tax=Thermohalobaculum xanthum TaxID=2753746 RepID=A0A8J7M994_9RHOB|nr:nucleotide exchange factor GrpE [Thermohalobaculum xanthum]MBK0400585.1 nucleotide exchange factor GrpE [Thermohalobaculum xanthum]
MARKQPQPDMEDAPEAAAPAAASEDTDTAVTGAEARVAELEAERDELKDRLLRALAEAENTRRRAERDRKDAETYGGTRLARDMLSVYDNLTRALAAADDKVKTEHAGLFEGIELTRRELLSAFEKHKIRETTPERGGKFDPNLHQAMFEAPVPGAAPGTIIEVMQAGFTIADRLLRPALVGVARAMPQAEAAPEADTGETVETGTGDAKA